MPSAGVAGVVLPYCHCSKLTSTPSLAGIGWLNSTAPAWSLDASVSCRYPNGAASSGGTGPVRLALHEPRGWSPAGGVVPGGAPVRHADPKPSNRGSAVAPVNVSLTSGLPDWA